MRQCNSCKEWKEPSDFWRNSISKDGLALACKVCGGRTNRDQRDRDYHKFWAASVIGSHKSRGISVSMSRDQLADLARQVSHCPRCQTALKWYQGKGLRDDSPTVDRLDNRLGLHEGNSEIVCLRCNRAKGTSTMEQYREWLRRAHEHEFGEAA